MDLVCWTWSPRVGHGKCTEIQWVVLKLPFHSLNLISACGGLQGIIVYTFLQRDIKNNNLRRLHCVLSLSLLAAEAFRQHTPPRAPWNPAGQPARRLQLPGAGVLQHQWVPGRVQGSQSWVPRCSGSLLSPTPSNEVQSHTGGARCCRCCPGLSKTPLAFPSWTSIVIMHGCGSSSLSSSLRYLQFILQNSLGYL